MLRRVGLCCLGVASLAVALAGCADEQEDTSTVATFTNAPTATTQNDSKPTATPSEVFSGGDPSPDLADTLHHLLTYTGTVVVGTVASRDGQREEPYPTPPGSDDPIRTYPVTESTLRVDRVILSDSIKDGDTLALAQAGGTLSDGRLYVDSIGGRLLEVGQPYLLFLSDASTAERSEYTTLALGTFRLTGERVEPNGHEAWPAVKAISGYSYQEIEPALFADDSRAELAALARVTIDEVAALITQSVADEPLSPD